MVKGYIGRPGRKNVRGVRIEVRGITEGDRRTINPQGWEARLADRGTYPSSGGWLIVIRPRVPMLHDDRVANSREEVHCIIFPEPPQHEAFGGNLGGCFEVRGSLH